MLHVYELHDMLTIDSVLNTIFLFNPSQIATFSGVDVLLMS